jgi:hypothetical protein
VPRPLLWLPKRILQLALPVVFLFGCTSKTASVRASPVIGISLDASDRQALDRESSRTTRKIDRGEPLSTTDVKKMTQAGLSDDLIISQIDATKSKFHLSSADIIDLKKAGVSQRVITHMIQTGK